jgi:hypothetical protein
MSYTLGKAAKATGKSKAALSRAIKLHKISANKQEDGSFQIDPAELHRVYPPVQVQQATQQLPVNTDATAEIRELRAKLEAAIERIADKDGVIDDMRRRLDGETEERRKVQAQLTALLTDQRPKPEEPARRSWWHFGKRSA